MVKIPSFDDLKKMGSGLIDSAKSVNLGEVVDKLKTGVNSAVSSMKSGGSDEATLLGMSISLDEIAKSQPAYADRIKKIQSELSELAGIIQANKKVETPASPPEEKK